MRDDRDQRDQNGRMERESECDRVKETERQRNRQTQRPREWLAPTCALSFMSCFASNFLRKRAGKWAAQQELHADDVVHTMEEDPPLIQEAVKAQRLDVAIP